MSAPRENQLGRADVELLAVAILLAAAGFLALRVHGHVADARRELRRLRGADTRAAELVAASETREGQLDGALEELHRANAERDSLRAELEREKAKRAPARKPAARKKPAGSS